MFIPLVIALIGCAIAGLWDLFTTDIPDEVSESMIIFGIFYWILKSLQLGTLKPLLMSLSVGIIFFLFGYVLYKTGQWGGGDAKLLAGIGFLVPFYGNMKYFPLHLVMNVFVVGAIYVILYSIVVGFVNNIWKKFYDEIPKTSLFASLLVIIVGLLIPNRFVSLSVGLLGFLIIFWYYAKTIEKHVFVKRIPTSKLKVGDVLFESKEWEGITKEELEKLRKKKYVKIKEGVRFGPVFFFALLLTVLYGNVLFYIF